MTINAWQEDAEGKFFKMLVGAVKDFGVDVVDWLDTGDALNSSQCIWTLDAGVTASSPSAIGTLCRVILQATVAGAFNGKLTFATIGGLIEIVPFRVIVK